MKAFLSKKLFEIAENRRFAIPAFNIFNLESARSVVSVAEKFTSIIILQISESTLMKYFDMEILLPSIKEMISKSNVPIVLHLDHARDLKIIKKAVKKGFTSVMFDGSLLPLDRFCYFYSKYRRLTAFEHCLFRQVIFKIKLQLEWFTAEWRRIRRRIRNNN